MTKTAFFDATGQFLLAVSASSNNSILPPEGAAYSSEYSDQDVNSIYYDITAEAIAFKPRSPVTISRNQIENIPVGSTVILPDEAIAVDDGAIKFEANVEETITVIILHPFYLDAILEVETGP